MSDPTVVVVKEDRRAPPPPSINKTAAIAGGGGYLIILGDYIAEMITQQQWLPPSKELIVMTLTLMAPVVHLLCRVVMNRLRRFEEESD